MEIIASGRRTGKTTRLIQLADEAEKNGEMVYIVCHDHAAARDVVDRAREMGVIIRYPITYEEMQKSYAMNRKVKFMIDNVDYFIQRQANGHEVLAVTFNEDQDV